MNDLISRNALIEELQSKQPHLDLLASMIVSEVIDIVKKQPTAYDVDAVLEQIKGLHKGYECTDNEFQRGAKAGAHYVLNMALDIIRKGGKE